MKRAKVKFEPAFVEEAVCFLVRQKEEKCGPEVGHPFYEVRNQIYEGPKEESEGRFKHFYEGEFSKLGLEAFFLDLLSEFPFLDDPSVLILMRCARRRNLEGAELFIHEEFKTALIGIQIARLSDLGALRSSLRHELMHISDMLDPEFRYVPSADLGGASEIENDFTRERFRILWDLYVDSRMQQRGWRMVKSIEEHKGVFEKAFGLWSEAKREKVFQAFL